MNAKSGNLELNTPIGAQVTMSVAGAGSRAYAYIIDWHLRILLVLVWMILWRLPNWSLGFTNLGDDEPINVLWLIIPVSLLYLLYHPVVELLMHGSSPGKRYVGLRCVDAQGNAPTNGAILLRNIMRVVDSLPALYTVGMVSIIFSQSQQRLGDMVADTRVVMASEASEAALERLDRIERSNLAPDEAEFVAELLERWKTLSVSKRQAFAGSVLDRQSIEPASDQRGLKKQLEALLG